MDDYLIGIRLALDNGVSEGLNTIRADLAVLDRAVANSAEGLRALMRRPRFMVSEVLKLGNLKIDSTKQKATRSGQDISLTRKEFALLEYLIRNRGRVVSRAPLR